MVRNAQWLGGGRLGGRGRGEVYGKQVDWQWWMSRAAEGQGYPISSKGFGPEVKGGYGFNRTVREFLAFAGPQEVTRPVVIVPCTLT